MPFWRSQRKQVYHECQRCGRRQPLAKMRWQNGILVCDVTKCVDTAIIGSRDINVARAVSINRHEFEPDRKLIEPSDRKVDMNEIMF